MRFTAPFKAIRFSGALVACIVFVTSGRAVAGATVDWRDPPQGVFEDRWYVVLVNGQRSGYSRMASKRVGQTIESLNFIEISIQRGAVNVKMVMKGKQRETVRGEPLGFESKQKMAKLGVKKTGEIRDGRVYITTTQQGQTTRADYAWDPKAKMAWAVALATRTDPLEVGKTWDLWVYDVLTKPSGPIRTQTELVGTETIELIGRKVKVFKAKTTTYLGLLPITSVSYVDENGVDLKMTMDMGFIKAELIACSEAYARRKAAPPELFVQTFVELRRPLDTDALRRVRYRMRVDDKITDDMFPTTTMQTVVRRTENEIELDIRRTDWSTLAQPSTRTRAGAKNVPEKIKPYLQASTFLNAKDPTIVKLAREAVGSATDPIKMADLLRRFATDFVEQKDLSVGLATASEVARSRQGDCTEHAVLLAAMARAAGIPARCVGGMVYVPVLAGREHVFGFHMWTQVWIAGQWVDVDAALRQTECDPSHIAMTIMPLNEDSMVDIAVGILPFIGKTRIDVLETAKKGK